jgi:PD-(D/E)XK endonuclease
MAQNELSKLPLNTFAEQPAIRRPRYSTPWALANVQRDWQANEEARLGMKPPIVRGRLWSKRRGEVSELAFFYKAAGLGFGVAKPWGDSERYDFILDSGQRLWRVQVKSACHHFNRRYDVHAKRGNCEKTGYTSADIDILVAYLTPIDVYYVIPVEKLERKALYFYPYGGARCGRYEQYREAWSLMAPQTSGASFLSGRFQNGRAWPGYLNPRFL